ncbi:hypothetical protein FM076_02455 [Streptomyces albus subsp. chlorinus]|uniref:hypothetical protein n=1 Tax=Streptomyces albus TaxID=1888 RepID=UPI00156E25FF|nr:hypothetical protein [Streptomyces albus subsp. chlorinus]
MAATGASIPQVLIAWDRGDVAELPAGRAWDVVAVPSRVGWTSVLRYLSRMGAPAGPVLSTVRGVHWLVAPGTADGWDLPTGALLPAGSTVTVPHPVVTAPHTVQGHSWIVPPRAPLMDGADLYGACAAYSASRARHLGRAS